MKPSLLEIRDLTVTYGGSPVAEPLNLDIQAGETVALTGPSGSGKTSVAMAIAGMRRRTGAVAYGSVRFGGRELIGATETTLAGLRGSEIGSCFQDPAASLNPTMRVRGLLQETVGLDVRGGPIAYQADYPHPRSILYMFDGAGIVPDGNTNFGSVDVPEVNTAMKDLQARPLDESLSDWAGVDRQLVEGSHLVPVRNQDRTVFMSERMDFDDCAPVYPVIRNDYASFCLK